MLEGMPFNITYKQQPGVNNIAVPLGRVQLKWRAQEVQANALARDPNRGCSKSI